MNIYVVLAVITAFFHGIVAVYMMSASVILSSKRQCPWWYTFLLLCCLTVQIPYVFLKGNCPLVDLENYFWSQSGQSKYSGGFISHYTRLYFGIEIPDGVVMFLIGIIAGVIVVHSMIRFMPKKFRKTQLY